MRSLLSPQQPEVVSLLQVGLDPLDILLSQESSHMSDLLAVTDHLAEHRIVHDPMLISRFDVWLLDSAHSLTPLGDFSKWFNELSSLLLPAVSFSGAPHASAMSDRKASSAYDVSSVARSSGRAQS
ncbi:MAG: hypothetical protein ABI488_02030 [Polyangiaceae bacterium]